ncbi:hypothetical protein E2986_13711 [Frieseomelitta varia]|uniref:Protein phosphatase inhibitor 2 n=1 Tax=Frieseomelitta varia TaxID=561572 RepID=A0A833SDG4_9HYME|nr:hypothetical protein E2986_13711 [Frieseomelitta varia]
MAENLSKRPPKGILKSSSSFDNPDVPRPSKETKWDEMNIIATLHPPEKDYGHMKIDEPKTPYNYEGLQAEFDFDQLDSTAVAAKLAEGSKPKIFEESSEDEDEKETLEERGLMDKFESQFEDLDVQSSYMENAMSQTTTTNIPQNDVDSLLQQVADEAGLELNMELPSGQLGSIGTSTVSQEQDELTQRLARLRE